jgi:hypothetical protein
MEKGRTEDGTVGSPSVGLRIPQGGVATEKFQPNPGQRRKG